MKYKLFLSIASAVALVAAAVVVSGCGGGDDTTSLPAPLENALTFMPKDSAVVAVVPTNRDSGPIKQLDELASGKVGGWDKLKSRIQREVTQDSALGDQASALFGNPIAIAQAGAESDNQYVAIQVQNSAAIKTAAEQDIAKNETRELPTYQGAFLWEDTDDSKNSDDDETEMNFNALKGNMLIGAVSEKLLKQALDNASGDDNLASNNDFTEQLAELGEDSLARVVGDAQQLLSNSRGEDTAAAKRLKFVKSLGMFYSRLTVTGTGITSQTTLKTDGEDLSEDERPLPAGGTQLTLPGGDVLAGIAVSDPDHVVKFAESVFKQTNAQEFGQYELGVEQLEATTGVDLHADLLGQIDQLSVTVLPGRNFELQAKLKDGKAVQESLRQAQTFIQGAIGNIEEGLELSIDGPSSTPTYVVSQGRREVARFAVKDDVLVGSIGPAGSLPSPTASEPIEGADGALGLLVDLTRIDELPGVEDQIDSRLARKVLESLGTVSTSVSETEDEITEKSTLVLE